MKPRSSKTNSQGADMDKLNAALKRKGLLLPHKGPRNREAKRIFSKVNEQYDV